MYSKGDVYSNYYKAINNACLGVSFGPPCNKINVYKVKEVDLKTFEIFKIKNYSNYAKDRNYVYHYNILADYCMISFIDANAKIKNADPQTFEVLNETYAKDKNHVYKNGEVLDGVDPESFEIPN